MSYSRRRNLVIVMTAYRAISVGHGLMDTSPSGALEVLEVALSDGGSS